jgi:hypothetical protein
MVAPEDSAFCGKKKGGGQRERKDGRLAVIEKSGFFLKIRSAFQSCSASGYPLT